MKFSLHNVRYMQYLAAITASSGMAAGACHLLWTSPSLPQLTSKNSPIGVPITNEEGSWVVSLLMIASAVVSPLVVVMVENIGRRWTLLASGLIMFLPWILILFANNVWYLYIARVLAGTGLGIAGATISIYNGEIADTDIRGILGTTYNLMTIAGCLVVLLIGPFVSYTVLSITCGVVTIVFFATFYFMPESPYYYVKIGKIEDARSALRLLAATGTNDKVISEKLSEIENTVKEDMKNEASTYEFFTKPQYRRVIFIIVGVMTLKTMSGQNAIDAYLESIIKETVSSIGPEVSSIIYGVVQIPSSILASTIVDRYGRKPILIISSIGCAIAMAAVGIYFYMKNYLQADVDFLYWLPISSIVLYVLMTTFGVTNIPYVLLGELFPTNIKSIAVTYANCYAYILGFGVLKLFETVWTAWGAYTPFWIFGVTCLLGVAFVQVFVPETKGKTFAEIQNELNYDERPSVCKKDMA